MNLLSQHRGAWSGTNGFRLMPFDPVHAARATAVVTPGAGGAMVSVAYTWSHPEDGEQDGLLVLGPGPTETDVVGLWGDTWHQQPPVQPLTGGIVEGIVTVSYAYGGGDWGWQIVLDARDSAVLRIRMDNVVPASAATADVPAGPYSAMATELHRQP